jgi:hypothetical protein
MVLGRVSSSRGEVAAGSRQVTMTPSMPAMVVDSRRAENLTKNLLLELLVDGGGAPNLSSLAQSRWVRLG